MADHVAVLRRMLASFAGPSLYNAAKVAALDHAIAACEGQAAIAAGDGTLHGAIDHWQERAIAAVAERDALVARLGELERLLRQREPDNGEDYTEFDKGHEQASDEAADLIARVVKEGGG